LKTAAIGVFLTALVGLVSVLAWGREGLAGALSFGALATGIQVIAVSQLRKGWGGKFPEVLEKFGIGMGLRLAGVVVLAVVVSLWSEIFLPLPSALGFLGVLIPLLYMELKLVK
jgi:hypothetical protein